MSSDLSKRKKIMSRSIRLGHCICDPRKPCPCSDFKEFDVCECAGESLPTARDAGTVRLTETVRGAGCASKISKKDLVEILQGLPEIEDERVLVGASAGDDAGVVLFPKKSGNTMVLTVDVFAPSVDDPYTFGQIAAANSVSDIYAMGAEPWCALSIIGFPIRKFPNKAMREILRGGIDKMREAGISVVGGHSINDESVKCGFAVIGISAKEQFVRNRGAKVGDALVLTKPIGVGITAFAGQIGHATRRELKEIADSMKTLNRIASESMHGFRVHAATDVTGFSFLGHLAEMVRQSRVEVEIDFDRIPLFSGTARFARRGICPGAIERNRESVGPEMLDLSALAEPQTDILFCPETSGGLLVSMPQKDAESYVRKLHEEGVTAATIVGHVARKSATGNIRVVTEKHNVFKPRTTTAKKTVAIAEAPREQHSADACCASPPSAAPSSVSPPAPSSLDGAFSQYMATIMAPGAMGAKQKKLTALALSVATKCGPCIRIHIDGSRAAGASDQEISEAVSLGIAFGGAPAAMFYKSVAGSE